jgi:hypothetical protein
MSATILVKATQNDSNLNIEFGISGEGTVIEKRAARNLKVLFTEFVRKIPDLNCLLDLSSSVPTMYDLSNFEKLED